MDIKAQIFFLLIGGLCYLAIRVIAILRKIKVSERTNNHLLFMGTLIFLVGNISISLDILAITSRGELMNDPVVQEILCYAHAFMILAFILTGAMITYIVTYFITAERSKLKEKDKNNEQTNSEADNKGKSG